jgi:hypothetical protein
MSRWTQTFLGNRNYMMDPACSMIHIVDIAHSLAMKPRFGGMAKVHYSVAEHSVRVAELAEAACPGAGIYGLLHDPAEGYLFDLGGPYKSLPEFAWFRSLEARWMLRILGSLGMLGGRRADEVTADDWWMEVRVGKTRVNLAPFDAQTLIEEAMTIMPRDEYWSRKKDEAIAKGWTLRPLDHHSISPTPLHARTLFLMLYARYTHQPVGPLLSLALENDLP